MNEIYKKGQVSDETLTSEDASIASMLGAMRRVEAPGDFNIRVRSRIRAGKPVETPTAISGFAWLKFAIPGLAVAIIGGVIGMNSLTGNGDTPTASLLPPTVASPVRENVDVTPSQPETIARVSDNFAAEAKSDTPQKSIEASVRTPRRTFSIRTVSTAATGTPVPASPTSAETSTGGSVDMALKPAAAPILAKGTGATGDANGLNTDRRFEVKQIFSAIGIDAEYGSSGWNVISVRKDSPADRAKVQQGDKITAVDDLELNEASDFKGKFEANRIVVIRDGKRVTLDLVSRGQ